MKLQLFADIISRTALGTKLFNFAACGNPSELNPQKIKEYPIFLLTPNGGFEENEFKEVFNVTFYYFDRLLDDDSNEMSIYSTGIASLKSFITAIKQLDFIVSIDNYTIQPFQAFDTQVLADRCCGVYTSLRITVLQDSICADYEIPEIIIGGNPHSILDEYAKKVWVDKYFDRSEEVDEKIKNAIIAQSGVTPEIVQEMIDRKAEDYNPTDNFKTINGESIIGKGNIEIEGGGVSEDRVQEMIDAQEFKTINGNDIRGEGDIEIQAGQPDFNSIRKVDNFLYEIEYSKLDYPYAEEYFEGRAPVNPAGCSAFRNGNFIGRNYDWIYNNQAKFVVVTPEAQGHYAVIGAASHPLLNVAEVEERTYSDKYKLLPFYLQDGVNQYGLFAEINVVPASGNTQNTPLIETRDRVCAVALVRYILDHYRTVTEALSDIENYVQVYFPTTLLEMGYECHLLIADSATTKVCEMVNNRVRSKTMRISTNYIEYGVHYNEDGSVNTNYTAASGQYPSDNRVQAYGSGLERHNLLNASEVETAEDMKDAMRKVYFSKAYTITEPEDVWYSEFVGGDITVDTPYDTSEFASRIATYRQKWAERSRETEEVWITRHSCVYDLEKRAFDIEVEESGVEHHFQLNPEYATKNWVREQGYLTEHQDISGKVDSVTIRTIWTGTQEEYDAISPKLENTLYIVKN